VVCLSVCHDREPCRTAEPTEMLFGMWTRVGPKNHTLDGGPDVHARRGDFEGEKGPAQDMPGHVHGRPPDPVVRAV